MIVRLRTTALVAALLALVSAFLVSGSSTAQADGPSAGGLFVPLTPTQIADTVTGFNTTGSNITTSSPRDITVLGVGGVPSTGVSAVVLNAEAKASSPTNINVRAKGTSMHSSFLSVGDTANWQSSTVVVAPGTSGKVTFVTSAASISMHVDVQGYFTTTTGEGQPGGFVPVTPTRVVNSLNGTGTAQAS